MCTHNQICCQMRYLVYILKTGYFKTLTYQEINNQVYILVSIPLILHFAMAVKLDIILYNRFCSCA